MTLKGTAAGAANAVYMSFLDSANVRDGYVGVPSSGNRDVYLTADAGDIRLFPILGSVTLYDTGVIKLSTSSTGVTVTGTCTAATFSGSGASLTALNAANVSTGTLAVLRGGTGVTTGTGTGSNVLSASPALTGVPTAPTAAPGTNTTQLATTAFVQAAITEGQASAWVNFNGTGTVAIRDSFNVSSITDNGTGLYTVNFASAMSNASYATACSVRLVAGHVSTAVNVSSGTAPTTSGVRIETANTGSGRVAADASEVYVAVFGG
ncbi:hypothetical protein D3C85_981760 [compost metagenome]